MTEPKKIHPLDLAELMEKVPAPTFTYHTSEEWKGQRGGIEIDGVEYIQDATIPRSTEWEHWVF